MRFWRPLAADSTFSLLSAFCMGNALVAGTVDRMGTEIAGRL